MLPGGVAVASAAMLAEKAAAEERKRKVEEELQTERTVGREMQNLNTDVAVKRLEAALVSCPLPMGVAPPPAQPAAAAAVKESSLALQGGASASSVFAASIAMAPGGCGLPLSPRSLSSGLGSVPGKISLEKPPTNFAPKKRGCC